MKKALAWLLVLAMTAALAVGGTLAYLTDTDEDVNVMTVGKVKIDQLEYERVEAETRDDDAVVQEFHDNKPLYPAVIDKDKFNWETNENYVDWEQIGKEDYTSGIWNPENINNEVDKMVFVKNKGDFDAYVRTVIAFEAGNYETLDEFRSKVHLNLNETDWTWEWTEVPVSIGEGSYFVATATYNKVLAPGALTEISLSQIALDPSATNEDVAGFGETYQVLVQSQAVQADGFDDPETALTEAFGTIPTADNKFPFDGDSATKGVDLMTALHYEDGNTANAAITAKVTNIVFGLNKDYASITDNYAGTLIDVEQDVPVYSYYVNDGTDYTVYVLASDDIYLPENSDKMFYKMGALKQVDTDNLNTSRTVSMRDMFKYCYKLKEIKGMGNWDTHNLESLWDTFALCWSLETLEGLQNWDLSNAIKIAGTFQQCRALTDEDVAVLYDWDMSNVEDISWMFKGATGLVNIDLSNWDTSNIVKFNSLFSSHDSNTGSMNIKTTGIENWDTSSADNLSYMFYGCGKMESIDLSNWDVSKNTTFNHFFTDCYSLKSVNFDGWDTSSTTIFAAMFNNCDNLEYVDVSSFDTQSATNFDQMFEYCYNLKEIKGLEVFDTRNVRSFYEMFSCCYKLEVLDLSSFVTSSLTDTFRNFNACSSLKTIYVGDGWDMSKVTSSAAMFSGCSNLVGGAGTTFVDSDLKYAHVDGGTENPGYLTHIKDKPVNP